MKTAIAVLAATVITCCGQTNTNVITELKTEKRTYKNARFGKITPIDAIIYHDGGIAKVQIGELPEPYKSQLWNDGAANKLVGAMNELEFKKYELLSVQKEIAAELEKERDWFGYENGWATWASKDVYVIRGEISQVLTNGDRMVYIDTLNGSRIERTHALLKRHPRGIDGDRFDIYARKIGTTQYTTVLGAISTIRVYDVGTNYVSTNLPNLRTKQMKLSKEYADLSAKVKTAEKTTNTITSATNSPPRLIP